MALASSSALLFEFEFLVFDLIVFHPIALATIKTNLHVLLPSWAMGEPWRSPVARASKSARMVTTSLTIATTTTTATAPATATTTTTSTTIATTATATTSTTIATATFTSQPGPF